MAVSLVTSAASSYTGTGSPRTAALNVTAGDLLVIIGAGSDGTTLNNPTNTGTAITWVREKFFENGTSWGTVYLWTGRAVETGSLTVEISRKAAGDPGTNYGFTVFDYAGVGTIGAIGYNNASSGAPALSMTIAQNSHVVFGAVDFNPASGNETYAGNGVAVTDVTSNNRFYVGKYGAQNTGTASFGLTAPTGQKWAAIAVELQEILQVTATRNVTYDVAAFVTATRSFKYDVDVQQVTATVAVTWDVLGKVEVTRAVSWDVQWLGTWREIVNTPEWLGMVTAKSRTVSARAEVVDRNGNFVQNLVFDTASIDYRGEAAEAWAGSVTFKDPDMVPRDPADKLDPRAGYRVRFWWRILWAGDQWFEVPVGTMILDDPKISDDPDSFGITVTARDILSVVRRTGYGQENIPVGGLTVDVAIKKLFAAVAPWVVVKVPPTSIVLPDAYQLGLDNADPGKDWTKLADLAGWVVRTDRMGTVLVGPREPRAQIVADWQEGPDCPVMSMSRDITSSQMFNRVLVRSTAQDAVGVWAVAEDDDPGSPTWVGRTDWGPFTKVIESDAVKTSEAALQMAQMQLGRFMRPTESVDVVVPQRPDLEYRDQIALARERSGVGGVFMVSGWSLRLGPADKGPDTMTVTMMQRTIQ